MEEEVRNRLVSTTGASEHAEMLKVAWKTLILCWSLLLCYLMIELLEKHFDTIAETIRLSLD
eukprot:scaffold226893_cov14-Tisochrysis_lutea.AAC.1